MSSVTHTPERSTRLSAAMGVVAAVLLTLGLINPAAAAPPRNPDQSAASWLAAQVNADGALEGFSPGVANYGTTLDGIIGLAAAGAEGPTAQRMLDYINANLEAAIAPGGNDSPGRISLAILANVALGQDPRNAGGVDLVARLQATERTDPNEPAVGLFGSGDPTYDGAYRQGLSLLALASVGLSSSAGEAWLVDQQCDTGSWEAYRSDTGTPCSAVDAANFSGPDTNSTALALLGLTAQGVTPDHDAQAWLESVRTPNGSFPYFGDPTQPGDASSTGLTLAALRTVSGTTDTEGLAGLRTFQVPCEAEDPSDIGGLFYQAQGDGSELPDNLSTAQGLWGLGDVAFPVIDATLADPVAPDCSVPTTSTTTPGPTTTTPGSTTPSSTTVVAPTSTVIPPTTGATGPPEVSALLPSDVDAPSSPDDAPSEAGVPIAAPAGPATTVSARRPAAAPGPARVVQAVSANPAPVSVSAPASNLANTGTSPNLVLLAAAAMLGIGAAALMVRRRIGMR